MSLRTFVRSRKMTGALAVTSVAALSVAGVVASTATANAAPGCRVAYQITNQWQGGFGANVTVTNLGDAISGGWTLEWTSLPVSGSSRAGTARSPSPGRA